MGKPTPLVLFARRLAAALGETPPAFPPDAEAAAVRAYVEAALGRLPRQHAARFREVWAYLERAARGGAPGTGAGSLKHLLWMLRDQAGPHYERLAAALLDRVLEDPDLPLHEGLAGRLRDDPVLGPWARLALEGAYRAAMARRLRWETIGGWRVAFNDTPLNLLAVAADLGADLYVAASEAGAALKAIREGGFPPDLLDRIAAAAGGRWAAPYPDLRVCREGAPDIRALEAAVRAVLEASPRT